MKTLICLLLALGMILAMAACGDELKKPYEAAVSAYNAGNYAIAYEMLQNLGNYEDATQMLASIQVEKTGANVETITAEGTVSSNVEYIFTDGNLVKENITHADGTVIKNYYKYNDAGLCTSETLNQIDGGKVVINHLYEDGIKVRSIRTNADKTKDTYVYACDAQGKILSHVLTLSDGTVEEAAYSYDDVTGLLLSIVSAGNSTTFAYNSYNDMVMETVSANGAEISKTAYTYIYNYSVG